MTLKKSLKGVSRDEMIEASILENVCESCLHRENDDCKLVDSGLIPRNVRVWDCNIYERAKG